jgi:Domain of unknown function (DUF4249)
MRKMKYFLPLLIMLAVVACKKQYNPTIIGAPNSYLVVEGEINSGPDSTFIKLSRTVNISSKISTKPELNAIIIVEGDQNTSYPLIETGNGTYACAGLNLDATHKYRLDIKTANSEQYQSDYVPVLNSPPIDSVTYDAKTIVETGPGLNIYVNTHDPTNKVQYYRWDYQETWEFHPAFESIYKSNGDTVLARDLVHDNIYQCWRSDSSSTIILGSSAKLSQSVIAHNPLAFINSTSEKVSVGYSILVRQYALTTDAYNFYTNLKKNTEQLGSIFDTQPSEINGNIHCVNNPSEPVIGYISVGSAAVQRIFVNQRRLPFWTATTVYDGCMLVPNPLNPKALCCYYSFPDAFGTIHNQVNEYINYDIGGNSDPLIPVSAIALPAQPPIGYTAAYPECADCTLRGTNKRPAFWQGN